MLIKHHLVKLLHGNVNRISVSDPIEAVSRTDDLDLFMSFNNLLDLMYRLWQEYFLSIVFDISTPVSGVLVMITHDKSSDNL